MRKTVATAMMCLAATAFVVAGVMMAAGTTMAQTANTCAYANDDVYYATGPNTVDGYVITSGTETYLSSVLTGGESGGDSPMADIVLSPTKGILYAADSQTSDVAAMKIDPASCDLTLLGNYPVADAHGGGIGLAINPNGRWIYAAGVKSAELDVMNVRQDGGLTGIRQKIALLNRPSGLAVSPDGATLLVAVPARPNNGTEVISYSVNPSTGMLTQVSMVSPHGNPGSISIDFQSKFVYVDEPNSVQARVGLLEIGPGSTLTFVRIYNFNEIGGSISPGAILLDTNGKNFFMTNPNLASLSSFFANSTTGALKYITSTNNGVLGSDNPSGLAIAKDGNNTFVVTGDVNTSHHIPQMGIFAATKDGSLTSLGTFPIGQGGIEGYVYPAWVVARTF